MKLKEKRAVCLLSGGLDSFVSAAIAKARGYEIYALTINYGQRNRRELSSAVQIADFLNVKKHIITEIDLSWTHSSLTDKSIQIPQEINQGEVPSTYVPARNTVFISIALALAETVGAEAIFTGINAVDYAGYPDCTPEYISKFQSVIDVSTKKTCSEGKIKLKTPLLNISKGEIITKGISLGLDLSISRSCYKNRKRPCGKCPSCIIRAKGFSAAHIKDPALKRD